MIRCFLLLEMREGVDEVFFFANAFYSQSESFWSQVIFPRQRTEIELREMYFHNLFITIGTACFLPVGWKDYICYGAHVLYRIGRAAEPCRSRSKSRIRLIYYAGAYRPTVSICRQKCWTFLSISFCTCMLPLTLCSWPQWPTMRFVSRQEPLALSNIRTIIIEKSDDSLQAPAHRQFIAKTGGLEDWESTSFCYWALTVCPWHRRFFVVWLAVFSIVNIEHCLLRDFFWVNNFVFV